MPDAPMVDRSVRGRLKAVYVGSSRAVRAGLRAVGLLRLLDEWAARSGFGLWVRSLLSIHDLDDLRQLDVPWWSVKATRIVESHLQARETSSVFEWGSGASTHWLASRSASVTSVEHDSVWAERVQVSLPSHANVVVAEPVRPASGSPTVRSAKHGYAHLDFEGYVSAIERWPGPFDVIVIDGRAREACLLAAAPHLAADGIILVDDTERCRYRRAIKRLVGSNCQ